MGALRARGSNSVLPGPSRASEQRGLAYDRDKGAQVPEARAADASHAEQIFCAAKALETLAKREHRRRARRADAGQAL